MDETIWPTPQQLEEARRYYEAEDELLVKHFDFRQTTFKVPKRPPSEPKTAA